MAWEWSHTNEAYEYARRQVSCLTNRVLAEIYAEWKAHIPEKYFGGELHQGRYAFALRGAIHRVKKAQGGREAMEDYIWERASEQATCTNGGWEAHLCPFGCGCHMVPFSK